MNVKVRLYTILKKYCEGKILEDNTIVLKKETTLEDLSNFLNIPNNIGLIFLVNNSPKDIEYQLQEGDEVKIFSFIGGG